ncbi:putative calcium-binding protein CML29 [Heracleum sosnowskyi]|uniref:Calcium-binding protein CML29 n=1 Tax=Heracleum sosnowskyi TaxID=360622 RepID=A0AAD8IHA1_9APIA|nr:putative calcium-binding protein CML29 [Heracleum sosnowskyi]
MAQHGSLSAETETLSYVLRLLEAFRAFDSDNDGGITAAELGGVMGSLGYNPCDQEVRSMMQQGDRNQDGLLSIQEFLELNTKELELGGLANSLKTVLEHLDFEGDEFVTGEELFQVMGNSTGIDELGLEECQAIIASIDGDGDGAIGYEDFNLIVSCLI